VFICQVRGGNTTLEDYKSVLDELSEIIEKYRNTASIIIGGDVNASIHRDKCNISHDIAFVEFLKASKMKIPSWCKKQSTFYHFDNRDESQIDYFIESEHIVKTYITFQREFQNLSTHDPVMISIEVEIPETLTCTHKGNNKITELRTILQRESQNS
jgi:hypothetical protein